MDNTFFIKALASGWNYQAIELWQLVRAVDYLESRSDVDGGHIGVYGISRGGFRSMLLGAVDRRLSLVLTSGQFSNNFARLFRLKSVPYIRSDDAMLDILGPHAAPLYAPGMAFLFDQLNQVALIEPRFFGVESGIRDPLHREASIEFKKVEQLYEHVGHSERAAFLPFNGAHEVSVANVRPFLKKWTESSPVVTGGAPIREP
jgi:hypothetical protein